jgi:hypothetical protein
MPPCSSDRTKLDIQVFFLVLHSKNKQIILPDIKRTCLPSSFLESFQIKQINEERISERVKGANENENTNKNK